MFGKKTSTPKIEEAVNKAVNYEVTIADMARRSERRAWFVAGAAILMALLLAGGYYLMLPLKERTPFLVMADPYRGTATVAQLRGNFGKNSIVADESINKSNLAHYVIARESYDLDQRDIRDWTVIFTMSAQPVAADYRYLYSQNNPNNLVKTFGRTKAVRIEIITITLLDSTGNAQGPGTGGGDATVRFQRVLVDKLSGGTSLLDTRIANIRYNYNKDLALTEDQRIENPLGFQVTSYRVDTEMTTSPVLPSGAMVGPAAGQPAAAPAAAVQQPGQPAPVPGQEGAAQQAPASATPTPSDPRVAPAAPAATQPNNANGVPNR